MLRPCIWFSVGDDFVGRLAAPGIEKLFVEIAVPFGQRGASRRCSGAAWSRRWCRRSRRDRRGSHRRGFEVSCGGILCWFNFNVWEGFPHRCAEGCGAPGGAGVRPAVSGGAVGAAAFAGFGRLHLQRVVEAVEVVEEADGAEQFDDLAFGVEAAQLGKLLVADGVGVAGDGFGQAQGGFFGGGEVVALRPVGEVGELVVGPAQVAGQDGVAGQAVGRLVHLAGADDDQLLELGGNRAGIEHGAEVGLHGGEDLRPVRHDAEHVGHVAALGKGLVVERAISGVTSLRSSREMRDMGLLDSGSRFGRGSGAQVGHFDARSSSLLP
jgi:hypothetical protein